jgi:hypothetical protein
LWGQTVSYSMGKGDSFPQGRAAGAGVKLMPRSRNRHLFIHSPYVFMAQCLIS